MRLEARKYLYDVQKAAALVAEFTSGKQFADYAREAMLRAAVEREFEIIGEALSQLDKLDHSLVARVSEYRRIIAFRNIADYPDLEPDDIRAALAYAARLSQIKRIETLAA